MGLDSITGGVVARTDDWVGARVVCVDCGLDIFTFRADGGVEVGELM